MRRSWLTVHPERLVKPLTLAVDQQAEYTGTPADTHGQLQRHNNADTVWFTVGDGHLSVRVVLNWRDTRKPQMITVKAAITTEDYNTLTMACRRERLLTLLLALTSVKPDRMRVRRLIALLGLIADGDMFAYVAHRQTWTNLLGRPLVPMPTAKLTIDNATVRVWPVVNDQQSFLLITDHGKQCTSTLAVADKVWLLRSTEHQLNPRHYGYILKEIPSPNTVYGTIAAIDLDEPMLYRFTHGVYARAIAADDKDPALRADLEPALRHFVAERELAGVHDLPHDRAERLLRSANWAEMV